jgi:hypothetical protein
VVLGQMIHTTIAATLQQWGNRCRKAKSNNASG